MCKLVELKTNFNTNIKVADIKKKSIENIIKSAPQCKLVSEIILFGSSLEERCTEKSDIDIVILSDRSISALSNNKSFNKFIESLYSFDYMQEYDRLYFKSINEIEKNKDKAIICNELIKNGKTIYKREEHKCQHQHC